MKNKTTTIIFALASAALMFFSSPTIQAASDVPMTNDDVIMLTQAGIAETNIIDAIDKARPGFDLSTSGLSALNQAGVTQNVITIMKQKASGAPITRPAQPAATAQQNAAQTLPEAIASLKAFVVEKLPPEYSKNSDMQSKWNLYKTIEIRKRAYALYVNNPKDPLRWDAVLIFLKNEPVTGLNANIRIMSTNSKKVVNSRTGEVIEDDASRRQTARLAKKLMGELQAATDVPDDTRLQFDVWHLTSNLSICGVRVGSGAKTNAGSNSKGKTKIIQMEKVTVTSERAGNARVFTTTRPATIVGNENDPDIVNQLTGEVVNSKKIQKDFLAFLTRWPDYDATDLFKGVVSLNKPKNDDARKKLFKPYQDTPNVSVKNYIAAELEKTKKP